MPAPPMAQSTGFVVNLLPTTLLAAGLAILTIGGCGYSVAPPSSQAVDGAPETSPTDSRADRSPTAPPSAAEKGAAGETGDAIQGPPSSPQGNDLHNANYYTVANYDIAADPVQQLEATKARATAEQKTILLQVGGDWCIWCKRMSEYMAATPSVSDRLQRHYLIQKVTYDSENRNEDFLANYPKIGGYPHLFVLTSDGQLLHSQDTALLEDGDSYSESAFVAFLDKWQPGAQPN